MYSTLNILMAQVNPTVGDLTKNREKMIQIIEENQEKQDVILFPELSLTGYPPEDLLFRSEFHLKVIENLGLIQDVVKDCHVIVGHPLREKENCYNAASIFNKKQTIRVYKKQHLPNYHIFDEYRYFTPGPQQSCIFDLNGTKTGLIICEDLWYPGPVESLLKQGITLLMVINASPFDTQKLDRRMQLLQSYARQGLNIVYINQIGGQDELLFDGQSLALNNKGSLVVRANAFEEQLCSVQIHDDTITGELTPLLSQDALIYKALVCGTRDYVQKNKFPGVLIGLSGGIDSALTLTIAVDALGADHVQAVLMPSAYTAAMSNEDALKQIEYLNVSHCILPIESAYDSLISTLKPEFKELPEDTTEENLQARIRGILLMALSNKTGKMVLTTSNKSETAVGYATLYGDMAGGFGALKDVLKTQVYQLAKYRNSISKAIPKRVLTRAPSAELKPNQKDQDSLPPYSVLDSIITAYMEQNLSPADIVKQGFDAKIVHHVIQLIKRNEYKRRQAAPGIKISPMAFGKDWRYPITCGFNAEEL